MEAAQHKSVNRSAAPRPAPAVAPVQCTVPANRVQLQSALRVSSPKDPAEKEAEATAGKIMRMAAPEATVGSAGSDGGVLRKGEEERKDLPGDKPLRRKLESPYIARFAGAVGLIQRRGAVPVITRVGEGQPAVSSSVASEISQSRASGSPLPLGVRRFMEPRFGADFSGVRIHTGDRAAQLSRQVSAQAFTMGNQIFFGRDRFQPDTHEGKHLIAHELTHTIQQGAATQQGKPVQRAEDVSVTEQAPPQVQRLGISDALDFFARQANNIPGFRMFTIVLGVNPINMSAVDRSAANILRAVVEFMPGGGLITQALDNYGVFDRAGAWIEQQLRSLGITGSAIRAAVNRFLDSLSWRDIFNLGGVWDRARRIFSEPIDRMIAFVRSLGAAVLRFIKDAILRPLAQLASQTRGWDLLKAVLGRDPITGDAVPRTAETLIGGFMRLIGQEEIWQNIQRGNAVARAWAWFQGALSGLMGFVRQIPQLFIQALQSLQIADIVLLPRAFARVAGVFGNFIGSFLSWAGNTVWNLLEIIFSVVAPGVMPYLQRAAGAFRTILRNPIGFVGNLVRAGIQGFRQFAGNFLRHLRASLIGWLTGAMSGANIYIPQGFNLREIIKFVLSVLGLTWQNIRQKLVRVIGETAVRALETGFEIVVTLVTQGPAAAWEQIQQSLSNLREMVMEQIMTFVRDRVVQAAVIRLVSMLNPAGAFIQAIIAIYNTVMFFIERLRQIAQVAMSFIDSIAAIAAGNIAAAANRVEQTMAGLLTLVISFLARIAGLGRVSDAVTNVINRVRQPIDRALDRVVAWIVAQARRLLAAGRNLAGRVAGWLGLRRSFTTAGGVSHSLFFRQQGSGGQLMIRSVEMSLETFLADLATRYAGDRDKLAKVNRAQQLVTDIRTMTAAPGAGGTSVPDAAAPAAIDAQVQRKIDELGPILQEIGDGVSMDGAAAAYRGLHWWVTPGQDPAQASREYIDNINRQYVGARQLSEAVTAILSETVPSGNTPTDVQIDAAVAVVRRRLAALSDATAYEAEGRTYYDRFHFLLGRYVMNLNAFKRRIVTAQELEQVRAQLATVEAALPGLARGTQDYFAAKRRQKNLVEQQRILASEAPSAYTDLRPDVRAAPFIATSLSAMLTARYALGETYVPTGKRKREVGVVGRILIFVASLRQLVADGTYNIDDLRRAGRIVIRATFSEAELTFAGDIPGSYLRGQLDVQAGQGANGVAGNAMGRASAEAQRFGGLR